MESRALHFLSRTKEFELITLAEPAAAVCKLVDCIPKVLCRRDPNREPGIASSNEEHWRQASPKASPLIQPPTRLPQK